MHVLLTSHKNILKLTEQILFMLAIFGKHNFSDFGDDVLERQDT